MTPEQQEEMIAWLLTLSESELDWLVWRLKRRQPPYLPRPPEVHAMDHIDGDPTNNDPANIRIVSVRRRKR